MNPFNFIIELPSAPEPEKVTEYLPLRVQYGSMLPVARVRLISRDIKEEQVSFFSTSQPSIAPPLKTFAHNITFESSAPLVTWLGNAQSSTVIAQIFYSDETHSTISIPINKYRFREMKQRRFERFRDLLRCPCCRNSLRQEHTSFTCGSCDKKFASTGNSIDFLTPDFKSAFSIVPTQNVSDHAYEPRIKAAIDSAPDRLFLDVGAGFRYENHENVVNFEIVDYPSTDILGVGECLPFMDNAFDGVISVAVLEHVKNPFACAKEIMRVLKPGGDLFCTAPFLQPFHADPHHYYNMTGEGLINLFPGLTILESGVPDYLHPLASITWILERYLFGLPADVQNQLLSMKIEDLLRDFSAGKLKNHPVFTQISNDARVATACGTYMHAVKPFVP